jgi:hypothetical protein
MKPYIDIEGASGSVYRFQRVDGPNHLPGTAGNFLFLANAGERTEVVCCGTARSLTRTAEIWKSVVVEHDAKAMFVRLNVTRSARTSEHDDIVEGQKPTLVVTDLE